MVIGASTSQAMGKGSICCMRMSILLVYSVRGARTLVVFGGDERELKP